MSSRKKSSSKVVPPVGVYNDTKSTESKNVPVVGPSEKRSLNPNFYSKEYENPVKFILANSRDTVDYTEIRPKKRGLLEEVMQLALHHPVLNKICKIQSNSKDCKVDKHITCFKYTITKTVEEGCGIPEACLHFISQKVEPKSVDTGINPFIKPESVDLSKTCHIVRGNPYDKDVSILETSGELGIKIVAEKVATFLIDEVIKVISERACGFVYTISTLSEITKEARKLALEYPNLCRYIVNTNKMFAEEIVMNSYFASNHIFQRSMRGAANFCICQPHIARIIESSEKFKEEEKDLDLYDMGTSYGYEVVGSLGKNGNLEIIKSRPREGSEKDNRMILGYVGKTVADSGVFLFIDKYFYDIEKKSLFIDYCIEVIDPNHCCFVDMEFEEKEKE